MNEETERHFLKSEDVASLIKEIQNLREELRVVNSKLSRIERRVFHVFPQLRSIRSGRSTSPKRNEVAASMTAEQLHRFYKELVEHAKGGNDSEVMDRLDHLSEADLKLLVHELGVSLGKKKATRKVLRQCVLQRIKESRLLSRHTNIPDG